MTEKKKIVKYPWHPRTYIEKYKIYLFGEYLYIYDYNNYTLIQTEDDKKELRAHRLDHAAKRILVDRYEVLVKEDYDRQMKAIAECNAHLNELHKTLTEKLAAADLNAKN